MKFSFVHYISWFVLIIFFLLLRGADLVELGEQGNHSTCHILTLYFYRFLWDSCFIVYEPLIPTSGINQYQPAMMGIPSIIPNSGFGQYQPAMAGMPSTMLDSLSNDGYSVQPPTFVQPPFQYSYPFQSYYY
jgi:hypothetical protein